MASNVPVPEHRAFDWHACRYFSTEQLEQLSAFVQPLATVTAGVFEGFCHQAFDVTVQPVRQVSVSTLLQETTNADAAGYALLLGQDVEAPEGAFWMPAKTARLWSQLLLGDTGDEEEGAESGLSVLEESLLCDLATAIVGALAEIDAVFDLQGEAQLVSGKLPNQWDPNEAFVKIVQEVKPTDTARVAESVLMLPCANFDGIMGRTGGEEAGDTTDYSSLIMANMHSLPVSLTVKLSSVVLTLEELMSLEPDDVLVLDQRTDQGLEIELDERVVFRGTPGKKQGKQAVLITECVAAPQ